jgi:beta-ribofuranosylaminobenzene 5'-phosphate synthase
MLGDMGRLHGSVGVAIKEPRLIIEASKNKRLEAIGPRATRIKEFAMMVLKHSKVEDSIKFVQLSDIPEHVGYGSGTQLALAVGTLVSELFELRLTVEELSGILGRARISGIGTHIFKDGGFIVDGGRKVDVPKSVPPLIFRACVPKDWFFIVGMPEIKTRVSGKKEKNAFTEMKPPPETLVNYISRLVLLKMIPAIIEEDIKSFGDAITQLDFKFGEQWIDIQGGIFSNREIEKGINFLLDAGVYGAGQSSWGPVFYGLVRGERQAVEKTEQLYNFLSENGINAKVSYTSADNKGAQIIHL